jgi:integrase/recombinase XerD
MMKADNLLNSSEMAPLDPAHQHKECLIKIGLDAFYMDLQLRGQAEVSRDTTLRAVRRYCLWCIEQGIDPQKARREDLLAYLADMRNRELAQSSIKRIFSCLSTWFEYLEDAGQLERNPVPILQKKYLHSFKDEVRQRQIISVEEAAKMIQATIDTRDRTILMLLFKTGIRRTELVTLDLGDIDLQKQTIRLKPTAKRSNRNLFFDGEMAMALHRWLRQREMRYIKMGAETALFLARDGSRLEGNGVLYTVTQAAERVGLHKPKSNNLEDHFTPHCCRHWFTTHLRRAGMPREFIQELRGDKRRDAIDIYDHIDVNELKESYLACIPQLKI